MSRFYELKQHVMHASIEEYSKLTENEDRPMLLCFVCADNQKDCPINLLHCVYALSTASKSKMIGISNGRLDERGANAMKICAILYAKTTSLIELEIFALQWEMLNKKNTHTYTRISVK